MIRASLSATPSLSFLGLAILGLTSPACVMERTVTENGQVLFEGPVVESPGKDLIRDTEETSPSNLVDLTDDDD